VITGIDKLELFDQACEAARAYQTMTDADVKSLLARTATPAAQGEFEPFKTTSLFDATAMNPSWLGEEPERVQHLLPT
jgi:hypothetical protein